MGELPTTATFEEKAAWREASDNLRRQLSIQLRAALPAIRAVLDKKLPIFGICLGHQLLSLALGARTFKLARGHRGANQPVKDLTTGKVEITSQNHGFAVDPESLPANAKVTHISLFDGTNEGVAATDRPAFSVQYHPEASPGPSDSHYLFHRFVEMIERAKA
jgi:carbamoyl-phosphate synthase small subunit